MNTILKPKNKENNTPVLEKKPSIDTPTRKSVLSDSNKVNQIEESQQIDQDEKLYLRKVEMQKQRKEGKGEFKLTLHSCF